MVNKCRCKIYKFFSSHKIFISLVKIAISCGDVDFSLIGDEFSSHYAIVGDPIWQVKYLQESISPGEILTTWRALYHTTPAYYNYKMISENRCSRITGFKDQKNIITQQYEANLYFQEMHKNLNRNMEAKSISNVFLEPSFDAYTFNLHANHIDFYSRKIYINFFSTLIIIFQFSFFFFFLSKTLQHKIAFYF